MRGRKKARQPLKEALESREPGGLPLDGGTLQADTDALGESPAKGAPIALIVEHQNDADNLANNENEPVPVAENALGGNAVAVPETDPERVAYTMWNEGRADEAIEFLERHLAAERAQRRETALAQAPIIDPAVVEPASDWRERHRAALSPADFNAFGASVHTIDVTPTPADAIVAHDAARSFRPALFIALALIAVGTVGAAGLWTTGKGPEDVAAQAVAFPAQEPVPDVEVKTEAQALPHLASPVSNAASNVRASSAVSAVHDGAPDVAEAEPPPEDLETTDTPSRETEIAEVAPSPTNVADIPADVREAAGLPPAETNVADVSPLPTSVADILRNAADAPPAVPAPEQALRVKDNDVAPVDVASVPPEDEAPIEDAAVGPDTTASIAPPVAAEPRPLVEARLPRQRPEPPPGALIPPSSTRTLAAVEQQRRPEVQRRPEPLVVSPSELQVYGPVRRLPHPRVYHPFARPILTPAEYQALLERRALAQDYAARRRAVAERRVIFVQPR